MKILLRGYSQRGMYDKFQTEMTTLYKIAQGAPVSYGGSSSICRPCREMN
jgi:hypothetical protein